MRAIIGLWRWRRNPLRRTTDVVEAWLALLAVLLIAVASPVAGVVMGSLAQSALQQSVRQQHRERHETSATVVRQVAQPPVDTDPETASTGNAHSRVMAHWTARDGSAHIGTMLSGLKSPRAGDRFLIWTDEQGRLVAKPLDSATAATHAALAGVGAGAMCAGLVEGTRRLILWRMVRRRYARWDQAWEKAGPDWGRTGTGC